MGEDHDAVCRAITSLIDHPLDEWRIKRAAADRAIGEIKKLEAAGAPAPKIFVDDNGVTLTWLAGGWKIYRHFAEDPDDCCDYVFWGGASEKAGQCPVCDVEGEHG